MDAMGRVYLYFSLKQITCPVQTEWGAELRAACCRVKRAFATRPKTSAFLLRAALGLSGEEKTIS